MVLAPAAGDEANAPPARQAPRKERRLLPSFIRPPYSLIVRFLGAVAVRLRIAAAERRQKIAHGVSRGTGIQGEIPPAPEGRQKAQSTKLSVAPLGLEKTKFRSPFSHGLRRGLFSVGPPGLGYQRDQKGRNSTTKPQAPHVRIKRGSKASAPQKSHRVRAGHPRPC